MKRRKAKSRMTRVDLDAVLKLQRDHDDLQYEVQRTFEYVMTLSQGKSKPILLELKNDLLSAIIKEVCDICEKSKPSNE